MLCAVSVMIRLVRTPTFGCVMLGGTLFAFMLSIPAAATLAESSSTPWEETLRIRNARTETLEKAEEMNRLYRRTVAERVAEMRESSTDEVHDLFRVIETADFYAQFADYASRDTYLEAMGRVAGELDRRKSLDVAEIESYYDRLLGARKFDQAAGFRRTHVATDLAPPPAVFESTAFDASHAASYRMSKDGRMTLSNVDLDDGAYVVVVVGCHSAQEAARSILKHDSLNDAFRRRKVHWVVAASTPLDPEEFEEWNGEFADFPLQIAYSNAAWKSVDFSAMPTFHFFKGGKLVDTHSGWDPKQTPASLMESLEKIGFGKPGG